MVFVKFLQRKPLQAIKIRFNLSTINQTFTAVRLACFDEKTA